MVDTHARTYVTVALRNAHEDAMQYNFITMRQVYGHSFGNGCQVVKGECLMRDGHGCQQYLTKP